MFQILILGLAAAIYPQLLAVVVVILTRPTPRRLLWACYLGALGISVGCGAAVLVLFRDRETVLGSTSHRLGASAYLILGSIAVAIAAVVATGRGRALLRRKPALAGGERPRSRTERALERGSAAVGLGVGAVLGVPGPFDLLALGRMSRGGYGAIVLVLLVGGFNGLKFALIELPLVSYALSPDATARRVNRFARWMGAYKTDVVAVVVAVIGLVLIGRGVSRLR